MYSVALEIPLNQPIPRTVEKIHFYEDFRVSNISVTAFEITKVGWGLEK